MRKQANLDCLQSKIDEPVRKQIHEVDIISTAKNARDFTGPDFCSGRVTLLYFGTA